jgi:hypothetical protein
MNNTMEQGTTAGVSPVQHVPSTCDQQIMKTMKLLANVIREVKREAGEATVSAARKTELEAWIGRHEAEIDARIMVGEAHGSAIASRETGGKHENCRSKI